MNAKPLFCAFFLSRSTAFADNDPAADLKEADRLLNTTFNQVKERLSDDESGKARLVRAQRAGLPFAIQNVHFNPAVKAAALWRRW